jgi:hypothetical protein
MSKINTYFQKLEVLVIDLRRKCSDDYRNNLFCLREYVVGKGFKMADKYDSFDRLLIFLRTNTNI